jgi:hypothetical protein
MDYRKMQKLPSQFDKQILTYYKKIVYVFQRFLLG